MKADWQAYPDNIGHKDWPGCFRCHDDLHKSSDGKHAIKGNDCNTCHTILAQGQGKELDLLSPVGLKFKHPGDEVDNSCNDCHKGDLRSISWTPGVDSSAGLSTFLTTKNAKDCARQVESIRRIGCRLWAWKP